MKHTPLEMYGGPVGTFLTGFTTILIIGFIFACLRAFYIVYIIKECIR